MNNQTILNRLNALENLVRVLFERAFGTGLISGSGGHYLTVNEWYLQYLALYGLNPDKLAMTTDLTGSGGKVGTTIIPFAPIDYLNTYPNE